jgi:hypothetical protein
MGKGSSAPAAPDPQETASAEAQFNRLDTYSPSGGGVRHGYTDANGNFQAGIAPEGFQSAQTYNESPHEQSMREALEPASLSLTNRVISDNIDGMPDAPRVGDRGTIAQDIFDRNYSTMQEGFDRENNRLLTNLQARGMPVGSEAFTEAYDDQQRNVNTALSNLSTDANLAAGQEQSRQFSLDQAERSSAISELVAAMGGGYNAPNALPSGQAAGVNYGGLVGQQYQADMAQYNANQQQSASTMGALGSLGGAMLMKSDRRLKTDIVPVSKRGDLIVYAYRYLWDAPGTIRTGYMAQEVIKHLPCAVWKMGEWFSVDYSILPEVTHA